MKRIVDIDIINSIITKSHPEFNDTEKNYCFQKLYQQYGSIEYDSSKKTELVNLIRNTLEKIKPKRHLRNRIVLQENLSENGMDFCYISENHIPDEEFEVIFNTGAYARKIFIIHGLWVKKNCATYQIATTQEICYKIPISEFTEIKK